MKFRPAWLVQAADDDPGCMEAFDVLDRYVDAVLRGDDVTTLYAQVVTHLENCSACREDTEGLLAAVRALTPLPPER